MNIKATAKRHHPEMVRDKVTESNLKKMSSEENPVVSAPESMAFLHSERVKRGLTQKQLAEQIGMSQPQLAKLEKAKTLPSLKTLTRYAQGLGLEVEISFRATN